MSEAPVPDADAAAVAAANVAKQRGNQAVKSKEYHVSNHGSPLEKVNGSCRPFTVHCWDMHVRMHMHLHMQMYMHMHMNMLIHVHMRMHMHMHVDT